MASFVRKSRNLGVISIILLAFGPAQAAPIEPENAEIHAISPQADQMPLQQTEDEGSEVSDEHLGSTDLVMEACLASHEQAQLSRLDGQLFKAEQYLLRCSSSECPSAVRSDCATWMGDLIAAFPSIVVRAHGDHGDIEDAHLYIDGKEVDGGFDGKSLRVDPGIRVIRVVLRNGEQREQRRVLLQGEKSRLIMFDFRTAAKPLASPQSEPRPPAGVVTRPIPISTIALGSVAVGAGALAIGFGVDALNHQKRAEEQCAPLCPDSVSERVQRSALISDVSLGISVAVAVGAVVTYLLRPTVYEQEATQGLLLRGLVPWGSSAVLDLHLDARLAGLTWGTLF